MYAIDTHAVARPPAITLPSSPPNFAAIKKQQASWADRAKRVSGPRQTPRHAHDHEGNLS
jgi:hypothetical protein